MNIINPNLVISNNYVYQQYNKIEWINKYFSIEQELIEEYFFNTINDYFLAMDIQQSNSQYITFYLLNMFGIQRPNSSASLLNYYDIGLEFDTGIKYDDSQNYSGKLNQKEYLIYLHYILNYKYSIWNIDFLISFICEWAGINKNDITLDLSEINKIKINVNQVNKNLILFQQLLINYKNQLGIPLGVDIILNTN